MAKTHNQLVQDWRETTEALSAGMDDLLGRRVRVSAPWCDGLVGTIVRINNHPSSQYGKSFSIKAEDPRKAGFGSTSGVFPHHVEVIG